MFAQSFIDNKEAYFGNLVSGSAWFDGTSDYLQTSFADDQESERFILAFWLKRTEISASTTSPIIGNNEGGNLEIIRFDADDKLRVQLNNQAHVSSQVFQDSNWHHFVISVEKGGTPDVSVYVDGSAIAWGSDVTIGANPSWFNSTNILYIGRDSSGNAGAMYLAQLLGMAQVSIQNGDFFISDFGSAGFADLSGLTWTPKSDGSMVALANTAGGNAFCLTDEIGDGIDASNNGNNFTAYSMSHNANGSLNTPSRAYAVLSPVLRDPDITLSNGNRSAACSSGATGLVFADRGCAITSGKYQFEMQYTAGGHGGAGAVIGIAQWDTALTTRVGNDAGNYTAISMANAKYDSTSSTIYGSIPAVGSIITMTYDTDTGDMEWFDDGVSIETHTKASLVGHLVYFFVGDRATAGAALDVTANFGDMPFSHPQAGYKTL